ALRAYAPRPAGHGQNGIYRKNDTQLSVGTMAFTGWFLILSLLLVWRCLMFRELPSIYNEPRNIYQPKYSLEDLKEAEVNDLQKRIDLAASSNAKVVKSLNRLRLAAAASPIVFIVFAAVASWVVG
ncbi:hypothetical protein, partial [Burkholderia multivorans]|uniref:hypothetical protein n=2 Tax=Burkholderia multivorans TaxID=87883 RepID=UPI00215909AC